MNRTQTDILREIHDAEQWQEELREQIEYLPLHSPERERKINLLFGLHREIAELVDTASKS